MHDYWEVLIKPLIKGRKPGRIVQVGTDGGLTPEQLLNTCVDLACTLHLVDVREPKQLTRLQERHGERFVFTRGLSLTELPNFDEPVDLFLLDGDHNWYTVINDLRTVARLATRLDAAYPITLVRGVGAPYGRRDSYRNPDAIPAAFRKRYVPVEDGQAFLSDSIYENDQQNGVLTAVEYLIQEVHFPLEMVTIPAWNGIAVVYDPTSIVDDGRLSEILERFRSSREVLSLIERLETARISLGCEAAALRRTAAELREENTRLTRLVESGVTFGQELEQCKRLLEARDVEISEYRTKLQQQALEAARLESSNRVLQEIIGEKEASLAALRSELDCASNLQAAASSELEFAKTTHARELAVMQESLDQARSSAAEAHERAEALAKAIDRSASVSDTDFADALQLRAQLAAAERAIDAARAELRARDQQLNELDIEKCAVEARLKETEGLLKSVRKASKAEQKISQKISEPQPQRRPDARLDSETRIIEARLGHALQRVEALEHELNAKRNTPASLLQKRAAKLRRDPKRFFMDSRFRAARVIGRVL